MASDFLRQRDDAVALGQRPHRVTEHFAGEGNSSLRSDMEQYAAGQPMSLRLASEIRAYQLAKVDDTWAEAAHRDVSRSAKLSVAAKVPYLAASQRLGQTLASVDAMDPSRKRMFFDMMMKHKAIAHPLASHANRLIPPRRLRAKELAEKMYRCGAASMRDWVSELGPAALKMSADAPRRQLKAIQRVQVEYLQCILLQGSLVSIPRISAEYLERVRVAGEGNQAALLHATPLEASDMFLVVDKDVSRKKNRSGQRGAIAFEKWHVLSAFSA